MKLEDYVKIYPSTLSNEFCDKVLAELKHAQWDKNRFYDNTTDTVDEPDTEEHPNSNMCLDDIYANKEIISIFWQSIYTYINQLNAPYFSTWNGFTTPRHNKYNENEVMPLHCDHIHGIFDGNKKGVPILSVLASLNDGYEGGELIMFKDTVIPMEKGAVVIFPSSFMYPHKVSPVIKGVRHTCVSWVY